MIVINIVIAIIVGKSNPRVDVTYWRPRPGQLKTYSVMGAPANMVPNANAKNVTAGVIAFLSAHL